MTHNNAVGMPTGSLKCPKCGGEMRPAYDDDGELVNGVLHCYRWSGGCGHSEKVKA